jgi:hypothetical protein
MGLKVMSLFKVYLILFFWFFLAAILLDFGAIEAPLWLQTRAKRTVEYL